MVSNALRFDPLLVHYLARELDHRLRGRACAAAPLFASERTALLALDGGEALRFDLHPARGWVRIVAAESDGDELDARCTGVEALPDERLLRVHLRAEDRFRSAQRALVVELHTNQWNALLVDEEDGRILSVLWERTAGGRALRSGQPYHPPAPAPRLGAGAEAEAEAWARWRDALQTVPPAERRAVALRGFAYLGAANVEAVLGEAAGSEDPGALRAAFEAWWRLRALPDPSPVLVRAAGRAFPYPFPLPGAEAQPLDSLLAGMDRLAGEEPHAPSDAASERERLLRRVQRRLGAAARRIERLEEQLAGAGEAERLRTRGDLLLAHLHAVPRGADRVTLTDWEGASVEIPLDPTLTPAENAGRWYDEARRRARADERLPGLLAEARAERERWAEVVRAVEAGEEAPEWALRALERAADGGGAGRADEADTRPYRTYRTSGGLEVRVGRSARDNDRLTFGHSSPNDVWLHARSVPGSHVILRWPDAEGAPPARDLQEAAGLAALFSKARTSGLVAVDWTRRKHVRRPRGAPPGAVIPQRVKTVMVEPDPALEERLRD